ncbi:hypothetical protein H8B13_11655 [Hymenobacter sp. BT188]|uniref:hypothetical protein n=1 Tax=Hymenobacter sp. BT188 TaxID=2763504 RepID=UPI001651A24C|nr:hypothetical protein [Hymenobacter sp. BT188]MBC6607474.1 hypothetical protein [Hymenobacter sp. BT188]
MMNIVTSLCVDDTTTPESLYPQLLDISASKRRQVYWQCVAVFFATSVRCNPEAGHILYTNDQEVANWEGIDFRQFLNSIGVEIRTLAFETFRPPEHFITEFRNAFYKLDVLRALSQPEAGQYSLLLDSDCVWTRPDPALSRLVQSDVLVLLDAEPESLPDTKIHGLSRRDMGDLYQELDSNYPVAVPLHFGGEIIGGSRERLAEVAEQLSQTWEQIRQTYPTSPPRFRNKRSIFDGDEYMTSFVCNRLSRPWADASPFIRRIWTTYQNTNVRPSDAQLTLWHLPNEKTQGIPVICRRVVKRDSQFWKLPPAALADYLGSYLGVPHPVWRPRRLLTLATKLPRLLLIAKRLLHRPATAT